MNINIKQQQLVDEFFNKVKEKYPEIGFNYLEPAADSRDHIWINVIADIDEDRKIEMMYYASELEIDILCDYGYAMSIMPENPRLVLS